MEQKDESTKDEAESRRSVGFLEDSTLKVADPP
jgi:hypothetical protein